MAARKTSRSRKTSKKRKSTTRKKRVTRKAKPTRKTKKTKKAGKTAKRAGKKTGRKTATQAARKRAAKKKAAKKKAAKVRAAKKKAAKVKAAKKKAAKKKAAKARAAKAKAAKAKAAKAKAAKKKAAKAASAAVKGAAAGKKKHTAEAPAEPAVKQPPRPSYSEILARLPYQEGSFVVHPKYGLGKVDRVVDRRLSTGVVPCMEIGFPYQEMKLTIPVDQVERSGLREPIGRREISDVFRVLKGRATFDAKRRSAKRVVDYRKRLSQGDPTSLAEAVRDLARLSLRKSLSYEERKILSTALRILSREVALARGREADDVREEIESIVYR